MSSITLDILVKARARIAAGSKDLPGEIIAARPMDVSFGFTWSARDLVTRVVYPGETTEHDKPDGTKVTLARWCQNKSNQEILAALDAAIASLK